MKKYTIYYFLLIFSILPGIIQASKPLNPEAMKKHFERIMKMQPLLHQDFKATAMNKVNKVLTKFYRLSSDNGKNIFKDTMERINMKWDASGNPVLYNHVDYNYNMLETANKFRKSYMPYSFNSGIYYKFYYIPEVLVSSDLRNGVWIVNEIDSAYFDAKGELSRLSINFMDSAVKIPSRSFSYSPVMNASNVLVGIEIDTAFMGVWAPEFIYKYDTTITSGNITAITRNLYDAKTKKWLPNRQENYMYNSKNELAGAYVHDYTYGITLDSFDAMNWKYFNTSAPSHFIEEIMKYLNYQPLLIGGNYYTFYDHYHYDFNQDIVLYQNSENITYNSDSTTAIDISTTFAGFHLDSLRHAYSWFADKMMQADTSQFWTGSKWQITSTLINENTYDVDGYLSSTLNKLTGPSSGTQFQYKDTYLYSGSAGIDEATENTAGMSIYPNPANNRLNIHLDKTANESVVRIICMSGQTVSEQHFSAASDIMLDLSNLNNGMYMVQYIGSNGFAVSKFIKQ